MALSVSNITTDATKAATKTITPHRFVLRISIPKPLPAKLRIYFFDGKE
jgi:hypothetical protein